MAEPKLSIPSFYNLVHDADINEETKVVTASIPDLNEDRLQFIQMGGEGFEIFFYHLLSEKPPSAQARVVLVKTSGDKGRDLLVYESGTLTLVVQCKNLTVPLTSDCARATSRSVCPAGRFARTVPF